MAKEVWMWLAAGLGYAAVNSGELLAAFPGGAEEIAANLGDERLDELLTQKQAEKLASSRPADFALPLAHAETTGVFSVAYDDPLYPDMLRSIHNPPPILFVKGDLTLLNGQLTIGIVGARRPSAYGVEAVKTVGRGIALGGAIIVSGLAMGLDAEAHKAALAVNGPTIACIAFGHDHCYPAANKTLMEVIERYGAVISEYPIGTKPEKPYFLHRNRLIAGLSHGLIVAEARRYSGTMSTANFATEYGRDVFAIPGSIFSELSAGTNIMIRDGAYLAGNATDVLSLYGIELPEDPIEAARKQAADGRPVAASASSTRIPDAVSRPATVPQTPVQPPPPVAESGKTLGEALQDTLQRADTGSNGPVSTRQAMEAFRKLQQTLPPTDDSMVDARNKALDEMVAAVSDSVEISQPAQPPQPRPRPERIARPARPRPEPEEPKKRIRPFPWDKVEHLSRSDLEQEEQASSQPTPEPQKAPAPERPRPSSAVLSTAPPLRTEPIGRVEAVSRVEPVRPIRPVAPVDTVLPAGEIVAPQPTQQQEVLQKGQPLPEPVSSPALPDLTTKIKPPSGSLSNKLRTLQTEAPTRATANQDRFVPSSPLPKKEEETPTQEPAFWDMDEQEALAQDPLDILSENAKTAYGQLGATPVSLSHICEGSGLSSGEAMAALTELELAGLSRQLAGRQFVIMQ